MHQQWVRGAGEAGGGEETLRGQPDDVTAARHPRDAGSRTAAPELRTTNFAESIPRSRRLQHTGSYFFRLRTPSP